MASLPRGRRSEVMWMRGIPQSQVCNNDSRISDDMGSHPTCNRVNAHSMHRFTTSSSGAYNYRAKCELR